MKKLYWLNETQNMALFKMIQILLREPNLGLGDYPADNYDKNAALSVDSQTNQRDAQYAKGSAKNGGTTEKTQRR